MDQNNQSWVDARGWIGFGCWLLVIAILGMILFDRKLLENDAFLILATAIVITGWVNGPVGWAYQATKGGGELADKNAAIVAESATAAVTVAATSGAAKNEEPQDVVVVNPPEAPVPTTTDDTDKPDETLPEYAR